MNCTDCKGTGKYVGFTHIDECRRCAGSGQEPAGWAAPTAKAKAAFTRYGYSWPTSPLSEGLLGGTSIEVDFGSGKRERVDGSIGQTLDELIEMALRRRAQVGAGVRWIGSVQTNGYTVYMFETRVSP